jgi:hypothetical protein
MPEHPDFGLFHIADDNNRLVAGGSPWHYSLDLEDIEEFLKSDRG